MKKIWVFITTCLLSFSLVIPCYAEEVNINEIPDQVDPQFYDSKTYDYYREQIPDYITSFNYEFLIKIRGLRLCNIEDSNYIFHQNYGVIAVIKYKCTPEGIITTRDKIFEIIFHDEMTKFYKENAGT